MWISYKIGEISTHVDTKAWVLICPLVLNLFFLSEFPNITFFTLEF